MFVGVRGCGKRSLGFIAATALGRRFVTAEHYFQKSTGLSRPEYLQKHGKDAFQREESKVSIAMLQENNQNCVIECGLASFTKSVQAYLTEYCLSHPVVYLVREMHKIKALLQLDSRALRLLENADPSHRKCSNFEYFNIEEDLFDMSNETDSRSPTYSFKLKDSQEDLSNFVRFITGVAVQSGTDDSPFSLSCQPLEQRLFTHCLWTQLSWYTDHRIAVAELEASADVIEINVDQWTRKSSLLLSRYVAEIRRQTALPIMFGCSLHTSTVVQSDCFTALQHGLRLGVDLISVDLRLPDDQISSLIEARGSARVLGSLFDTSSQCSWSDSKWLDSYKRAQHIGCDMVRFVRTAVTREDNDVLVRLKMQIKDLPGFNTPLIAFNLGAQGRTSQLLNEILTSVTHPTLPNMYIKPSSDLRLDLNAQQTVNALFHCFVLDPLRITILGANVSKSLSPAMHNAAYRLLGLEHIYNTHDVASYDDIESVIRHRDFGGASVVQPWKVGLVDKLTALSMHAKAIGAINTILPLRSSPDGKALSPRTQAKQRNRAGAVAGFYGDNTDWIGIKTCMSRSLSPRNVVQPKRTTALVVGAGGMARAAIYATLQMGCQNIFVYNRTLANAELVAKHFNTITNHSRNSDTPTHLVRVLPSTDSPWPTGYALPVMIISCVTQETIYGRQPANFVLPETWLGSETGGVVMEMSYVSKDTPLVQQIRQWREETGKPWVLVDGFETLPEQAIAQFELMTGRRAPRRCIREAIVRAAAAERELQ